MLPVLARTLGPVSDRAALAGKRRTLLAIYVVMGIAVAVVTAVVFSAGQDLDAEKPLAGGYDLPKADPCLGAGFALGATFDPRQAGEFVNIENSDGSLSGALRDEDGHLTGDVTCVSDGTAG